jgi:hypothetical protein
LDNLYVAGESAGGLPVTAGAYQGSYAGTSGVSNAFFAKFNPNLSGTASLVYSSYLGGSGGSNATGIAVDSSGNAYLAGADFANLPTTAGAYQTSFGSAIEDAFVAKFNPALSGAASLVYSTYLGGNDGRTGNIRDSQSLDAQVKGVGIAVDASGDAYVAGGTSSATFLTTPGAFQTTKPWTWNGFVTKFNSSGTGLVYSTYLGGTANGGYGQQGCDGIALDSSGDAYVTGWTGMSNFPTKNPTQGALAGHENAFVMTLNSSGSGLLFSSYLGGSDFDFGFGLALDPANNIYVTGLTSSNNFPTTAGTLQTASSNAFVFKMTAAVVPTGSIAVTGFPTSTSAGVAGTITVTVLNASGGTNTNYTGTVHFTSSDPHAVLPADYTFTAADQGVHTFTVTLETAGTQSITATDSINGLVGSDTAITVNAAAASTLSLTGYPSPTNAGLAGSFNVTAVDAYGNLVTGYTGTLHFTSSDPAAVLPADYTFNGSGPHATNDNGVHTFTATLNTTGTQSLTATDTAASITGTLGGIIVDPAGLPAVSFRVTGFPSPTTAGVSENITVTALDMNGAVAGSYRGTVHFTSSDPQAALPADYTFTNLDQGVHTFTVTLKTAGTQSITATDTLTGTITGSETGITINPGAAAVFVLSAPSSVTHGVAFSVTLTIYDAYGNVATGYTGTVHFSSSDSKATLPSNYTFKASDHGVHTFTGLVFKRTGKQSLTVADTINGGLTATDSISVV